MQIITNTNGVRIRSTPSLIGTDNVIKTVAKGVIFNADQSTDPNFWALTDTMGYIHHSVADIYTPPVPLPNGYIPYRSQEDLDAKARNNDCGEACVAMLLESRGVNVTVDSLKVRDLSGESSAVDLMGLLAKYGIASQIQYVDEGKLPSKGAMCLIWTGAISRDYVLEKSFTGQHWVVYLYEDIIIEDFVVVHDPNFYAPARAWGAYHHVPLDQWQKAHTQCDPSRQMVVLI